jgi:hypothetical protein
MHRALRTVFLLLLMTVVPIRGAIGVTMVMCGPGHGGETATHRSDAPPPHHAAHGMHAPTSTYDASSGQHDHEAAASAHDDVAPDSGGHHPSSACGLCADCCSGSIIVSTAASLPVIDLVDGPFPAVQVRFERRAPDGLERPPHTFLV